MAEVQCQPAGSIVPSMNSLFFVALNKVDFYCNFE